MPAVRKGLALAILFFSASSHAEDADAMIERGLTLREQGKDEEALALFQKAWQTTPSPRAKAQIALAEQALGRWLQAEKDLNAALATASDAWIAKHKTALEGALTTIRSHVGDLVLIGGVQGAEVRVDGLPQGSLPSSAAVRLDVGTHTLEITAQGYYPISQPVTIRSDAPARVSVEMHARSASDPQIVTSNPPTKDDKPPIDPNTGKTQRIIGIIVASSAVIPLGIGLGAIIARGSEVGAYNADPTCPGKEVMPKPPACQSHIDSAGALEAAGIAMFIVAGVVALTGGAIVMASPSPKTGYAAYLTPNGVAFTF